MGSIPNDFRISLQSWPSKHNDPNSSLPGLIQRINFERGSFREISEESLQQEIAEEEARKNGDDDNGTSEEEDEEEEKPDRLKELMKARDELIVQIEQAHQSAMYSLDFVSLLLSRNSLAQAGQTVSPFLRDAVGLGTLGADKIHISRVTEAQKQDSKRIAKGWKVQSLNNAVDSILASATRLEKEIELETKYWEQVLAVSENGWAICRLPNEKHTLGVRFGFSEAAPAFKNRSLAALRRKADGTISLDRGIASNEPQSLRVRIFTNDTETGSSSVPKPIPEDAPIESEILEARNTIFSVELWQEINRESRILAAYGVRSKGDTITYPLSPRKTIILDLVLLDDTATPTSKDDNLAEGISLSLHLLLSYAHRQNHRRRTKPPPPISAEKPQNQPYALLQPLITRLKHEETLSSLQTLFPPLIALLTSTRLTPLPSYTITTPPPTSPTKEPEGSFSTAEKTVSSLTERLEILTTFTITPSTTLTISSQTSTFYSTIYTKHHITLSPSSPLNETCKPPPPPLNDFSAVREYVGFAMGCALAANFATEPELHDQEVEERAEGWHITSQPHVLRKTLGSPEGGPEGRSKQLSFLVLDSSSGKSTGNPKTGLILKLVWDWMRDTSLSGNGNGNKEKERLREKGEGSYEWNEKSFAEWEDGEGEIVRSLDDVVEAAGKF